ncbi:hypothetical protein [Chamaesiphon sp. VAR_48_metabat_403]|uniref:hypothetical protein n=1 Tax=Chamaesiphon sp. VAR_48_metabat_403 TaxID=2964700 RepID=UPI00286DDDE4|nr:hypothetical protein [Chamaesiphon sp. VAR_48_metabat_403]
MRQKQLLSPVKPSQNLVEYRFKLLFLPLFGLFAIVDFLVISICWTFEPIAKFIASQTIWISILLIISIFAIAILSTHFLVNKCCLLLTSKGISGYDRWGRRTDIGWQEIIAVKPYQFQGTRSLCIKVIGRKNIHISPRFYQTPQLLVDRVRELAGTEHILARALEKELSRPRRDFSKLQWWVIGAIALITSIYLIGGNIYAADREKPLELAIASYVRQYPKTAPNKSAIELQALMAKLGLSVEAFGDGTEVKVKPEQAAILQWQTIEPVFKKYLDKQLETKESIEPFPDLLASYLNKHQPEITAIETHLINNPIPQWGADPGWIEKSDLQAGDSPYSQQMNSFAVWYVENLTILNLLDKQSLPNTNIDRDLAAIEKIQQSFQTQPSLVSQLVARLGERRISDLVRRVDRIPTGWGNNLFSLDRHTQMYGSIENYSMFTNRKLQDKTMFGQILIDNKSFVRFIPAYYHFLRPQIRLKIVDRHREVMQGLAYWQKQNICRTNGADGIIPTAILGIDDYITSTPYLASQYRKVLSSDLRWEATSIIRQVKSQLASGQKVELATKEFNMPSKVCPGENWTAKSQDGAVNIAFSHPPDWQALGVNNPVDIDPLAYTIKPIDRG